MYCHPLKLNRKAHLNFKNYNFLRLLLLLHLNDETLAGYWDWILRKATHQTDELRIR